MGSKTMSTTNPTVIDIILSIINLSNRPGYEILKVVKTFFCQPVAEVVLGLGLGSPVVPLLSSANIEFFSATNPVGEWGT
jgi:hypothetical protein